MLVLTVDLGIVHLLALLYELSSQLIRFLGLLEQLLAHLRQDLLQVPSAHIQQLHKLHVLLGMLLGRIF